jgi:hypothetical protein
MGVAHAGIMNLEPEARKSGWRYWCGASHPVRT